MVLGFSALTGDDMTRLNVIPKTGTTIVSCSKGDTTARLFSFDMYAGEEEWEIEADTVTMQISNGAEVTGSFSGNTAEFDCTEEVSATAGQYFGKLKFDSDSAVLYSAAFVFVVEKGATA